MQLAAFILGRGGPLPALSGKRGAVTFIFDDPEEKLGWEYWQFEADTPVPVRQLFWAMQELRGHMERYLTEQNDTSDKTRR
jgi:hypothetical protein